MSRDGIALSEEAGRLLAQHYRLVTDEAERQRARFAQHLIRVHADVVSRLEMRAFKTARARLWAQYDRLVSPWEQWAERRMVKFFARQGRTIEQAYAQRSRIVLVRDALGEYWWDDDAQQQDLAAELDVIISEAVAEFGEAMAVHLGSSDFDPHSADVRSYIEGQSVRASKYINGTTRDEVSRLIADAVEQGEGMAEIASSIRDYFEGEGSVALRRATVVARTEVISASNYATLEGAKAAGVAQTKTLMTAGDDRVDGDCEDLDGETVALDDTFSSGDDYPPIHPDCRCTVLVDAAEGWGDVQPPDDGGEGD